MDNTHHLSAVLPAGATVHDPVASDIERRGEKKQRGQEDGSDKGEKKMTKSVAPNLPFECQVGTETGTITNPYSGESVELSPEAVAVYDTIKGAEMLGNYDTMQKGLAWFRQYYPQEYMVLLD